MKGTSAQRETGLDSSSKLGRPAPDPKNYMDTGVGVTGKRQQGHRRRPLPFWTADTRPSPQASGCVRSLTYNLAADGLP